jgi:hypothetical protein
LFSLDKFGRVGAVKTQFGGSNGGVVTNHVCFFSLIHLIKKFFEFQKLCDVLTEKMNKLLRNVKTKWMNILFPVKHVMEQYRPLMAKMHVDASSNDIDVKNLSMLCGLELILRLHAILPHFRFHAYLNQAHLVL